MTLLSEESTERQLRARMYLEILGNTLLTEETAAWVRKTSSRLLQALRRREEKERFQSIWDFSLLKDKELDVMEEIFSKWKTGSEVGEQNIQEFWVQRQQKFLGSSIVIDLGIRSNPVWPKQLNIICFQKKSILHLICRYLGCKM